MVVALPVARLVLTFVYILAEKVIAMGLLRRAVSKAVHLRLVYSPAAPVWRRVRQLALVLVVQPVVVAIRRKALRVVRVLIAAARRPDI